MRLSAIILAVACFWPRPTHAQQDADFQLLRDWMAVGGEGVFALALPFWSGTLSDRLPRRIARRLGRRMAVVAGATLVLAGAVAVAPFLPSYWALAGAALLAFAGLHAYLTPFWALLIDAVPDSRRGRVQGMRGLMRSAGLAYGLDRRWCC